MVCCAKQGAASGHFKPHARGRHESVEGDLFGLASGWAAGSYKK